MSLTDRDALMHSFKVRVSALIKEMGELIIEQGGSPEDVTLLNRSVMVEAMVLAAFMHDGNQSSFVNMADTSIRLVRSGAITQ